MKLVFQLGILEENMEKKIGTANYKGAAYFGLVEGQKYILDIKELGVVVYNLKGTYITASRTDAFDNIHDFCKHEDRNCLACDCYHICSL